MIIYGYREATLQTKLFDDRFCTDCGQKGTIACTVFSRHAHMMWIPLFPIGKRVVVWCQHCNNEYSLKELRENAHELYNQIKDFKRTQKAPFWQWVGLLLIVGLVGSAAISGVRETQKTKKYLESPNSHDVYCTKYEKLYSLMYLIDIRNDSIIFLDSKYTTNKEADVKNLHRFDYYNLDTLLIYSHDDLKALYKDNFIVAIWRNLPFIKPDLMLEDEEEDYDDEDDEEDGDDEGDDEEEDEED